jgi:hypothetical protein
MFILILWYNNNQVELLERRWRKDGRFMRLFGVVEAINSSKWNLSSRHAYASGAVAPHAFSSPSPPLLRTGSRTFGSPPSVQVPGANDEVMPLEMLADITDASYDYHEPRSALVKGSAAHSQNAPGDNVSTVSTGRHGGLGGAGEGPSGSHWYFCELNRMLHCMVSRGQKASSFRKTADTKKHREGWLVLGAQEYLTSEFHAVLAQVGLAKWQMPL